MVKYHTILRMYFTDEYSSPKNIEQNPGMQQAGTTKRRVCENLACTVYTPINQTALRQCSEHALHRKSSGRSCCVQRDNRPEVVRKLNEGF